MLATLSATVQIFKTLNGSFSIESACNTLNDGWTEPIQFYRWRTNVC